MKNSIILSILFIFGNLYASECYQISIKANLDAMNSGVRGIGDAGHEPLNFIPFLKLAGRGDIYYKIYANEKLVEKVKLDYQKLILAPTKNLACNKQNEDDSFFPLIDIVCTSSSFIETKDSNPRITIQFLDEDGDESVPDFTLTQYYFDLSQIIDTPILINDSSVDLINLKKLFNPSNKLSLDRYEFFSTTIREEIRISAHKVSCTNSKVSDYGEI